MAALAQYITPTLIFPLLTILAVLFFFAYYIHALSPRQGSLEWIALQTRTPMTFAAKRYPMTKKDALPLLLVTAAYAATGFFQLGNFTAPQSFCTFVSGGVAFSLDETVNLSRITYYTGLGTGEYTFEVSEDGTHWYALRSATSAEGVEGFYWQSLQDGGTIPANAAAVDSTAAPHQQYSDLFKWITIDLAEGSIQTNHVRITPSNAAMELGELALYDENGTRVMPSSLSAADAGVAALFDEQAEIPAQSTWHNSTYFDEIYHARTAFEHIRGVYPYEISHPPLGKLILSIGIQIFGMVPFGWRFMGTLFGVLMLPLLYVFLKNMFGKTALALCGTAFFAFDFMHLTQTRIATIDTYAVFFILAMYFFMYRYLTLPAGTSFRKGTLPLLLSGLSFGLGAASKWTVLYAAGGLALLYFIGLWFRWRDCPMGPETPKFGPWLVKTLLFSVLAFVILPCAIYILAYLPYAAARGGVTLPNLMTVVVENQQFMFSYHSGVNSTHPYSSRWYQWLVDAKPILYYLDNTSVTGSKAAFGCLNNPLVCWLGLLSVVAISVQMVRRHCGKALFILVGFLSQMLPWLPITRPTFAYHYFPATVFLVLAICYVMNDLMERRRGHWRVAVYGMTGGAVALYALFYPVLIGLVIPLWYSGKLLRWLPSWPF